MNMDKHPLHFLKSLVAANRGKTLTFHFESYKAKMRATYGTDYEVIQSVHFSGDELDTALIGFMTQAKQAGLDVIVCSDVEIVESHQDGEGTWSGSNRTLHIPMIDFAAKELPSEEDLSELGDCAGLEFNDLVFYNSGRSFHAYGKALLTKDEWIDFMGALILVNKPGDAEIVDTRWVGHRLRQGSAGLRLTKTSPKYLAYPTEVDTEEVPF